MRDIIFRAKDLNGEWSWGFYFLESGKDFLRVELRSWEVFGNTVGQSTGLKDKNGTTIYEGDIVEAPLGRFEIKYEKAAFVRKTIFIHTGGGNITTNVMDPIHTLHSTDGFDGVEVIGNIHENKELLRGQN